MNKGKLAREIDHALKAAGFIKSRLKGKGWKGHGHTYRASGFMLATKGHDGVAVGYHVEGILGLHVIAKARTPQADEHLARIRSKKAAAISDYKSVLSAFSLIDKVDDIGMPYLLVRAR